MPQPQTQPPKGICRIRGEQVKVPQLQPAREPAKRMLEKCCHRERRLWEEAERRSVDPEYGPAYSRLARQAGERYAAVLESAKRPADGNAIHWPGTGFLC